jgi:hypothetical protein
LPSRPASIDVRAATRHDSPKHVSCYDAVRLTGCREGLDVDVME